MQQNRMSALSQRCELWGLFPSRLQSIGRPVEKAVYDLATNSAEFAQVGNTLMELKLHVARLEGLVSRAAVRTGSLHLKVLESR